MLGLVNAFENFVCLILSKGKEKLNFPLLFEFLLFIIVFV